MGTAPLPQKSAEALTLPHPIDRFRSVYGALESEWPLSGRWLRFAAQAVLMNPADPEDLAKRIHACAKRIYTHAGWFDGMGGEARFFIASMLVQSREDVTGFLGLLDRTREHLGDAELPHGHLHDALAILVLHLLGRSRGIPMHQLERLIAIQRGLEEHDWWHTGAKCLPVSALLTAVPGPTQAIVAQVVEVHHRLVAANLVDGRHLLGAASILPLSGLPPVLAAQRFLDLVREANLHLPREFTSEDYDALATLALLDQTPEVILDRLTSIHDELELADPQAIPPWIFALSADLTYLDLVRRDPEGHPLTGIHTVERMMDRVHLHRALLAVVAGATSDGDGEPLLMPVG